MAFGGPADGLNMKTVLYLTTNVASGVFGAADIFDNDGNPLAASADGAAPASSIPFTVLGNRVRRIVLSGDETLRSGWVRLTLSGNVHMISNAVFQTFTGSTLVSEAGVLEATPVQTGLIYVRVQGSTNVGLALANPQTTATTVTLNLFDWTGFLTGSRELSLPAAGHTAQFVTEMFPELAGISVFEGTLSVRSSAAVSALAVRLSGDKVATIPVAADGMHRPAVTGLRISSVQRSPAQVTFSVDLADTDANVAAAGATAVTAYALIDFGASGVDGGPFTLDGTALVDRQTGTLSGSFQPPRVTTAVPAGLAAAFYIQIFDALGNISNIVAIPIRF